LPDVQSVQSMSAGAFRILSDNGSKTTTDLVELTIKAGVQVKALSVQNTTLDDVFVHYTGRQLRDAEVKSFAYNPAPLRA
jgi:ABC-2 type transport system ATP-binding protein